MSTDITDIFSTPHEDDSFSDDVEQDLAGRILVKLAAEEGIDLNSMSEADLKDLAEQLRGAGSSTPSTEPTKEASHTMQHEIDQAAIDAIITQETFKVAAAEGVDASVLAPETFAQLKHAVAEMISEDDQYFEKQAAEEAFALEEARSEHMGRKMAQAFYAELQELQGEGGEKIAGRFSGPGRFDGVREAANKAMVRVGRGVEKHTGIGRKGVKEILDMGTQAGDSAGKHVRDEAVRRELGEHYGKIGRRATGAAAATVGAAGVGAGVAAHRRKQGENEEVVAAAHAILIANGYDPSTGTKVASLEVEPDTELAALELLAELGYPVE